MILPDEFDPDDNFDHAFGDDPDIDEEAALEAVAWQWLLLDELAARFNLRIDWNLDDDDSSDALDDADVATLINTAFDRLREHHYTLWTWETGSDHHGGWITRQRDDEALRVVAGVLGFHVRTGAG